MPRSRGVRRRRRCWSSPLQISSQRCFLQCGGSSAIRSPSKGAIERSSVPRGRDVAACYIPSMSETSASLASALADRYTVERLIGHGGMATVHLAEERKHRRKVAIKVLKQEFAASVGAERFLREIGIAARLSHPHIVPLIDSGESDGSLYYVQAHVPGGSLRDRLNREKQLPTDDAMRIAHEIGNALDYAHRNGFVHRDVK